MTHPPTRTSRPAPRASAILLLAALLVTAGLAIVPTSSAAGALSFGPPEPAFGNLPAYIMDASGVRCYPEFLPEELPSGAFPVSYPDNIGDEFAYFDFRAPVLAVEGGGTAKFRLTIQGFGTEPGGVPIIRNFVRLTLDGVPPGTYGVLDDPSGAMAGTTFVVEGRRTVVEIVNLTANAQDLESVRFGPITDITSRTGAFTLVRGGAVVASAPLDDFVGCQDALPPVAAGRSEPSATFSFACGGLRCALDSRASSASLGATVASHAWAFGDMTMGEGDHVVHAFPAAGSYDVTLNVTDSAGRWAVATQRVFVNDGSLPPPPGSEPPAATFTGVRTNNFLGVLVDGPVAAVGALINGEDPRPMQHVSGNEWRDVAPARNSLVQFRATLTDGRTVDSDTFVWPSFERG